LISNEIFGQCPQLPTVIPVNCPGFCSGFLSADLIFEHRSPVVARLSRAVSFNGFYMFQQFSSSGISPAAKPRQKRKTW